MKNIALLAIAMGAAVTGSVVADTPAKTDTTAMTANTDAKGVPAKAGKSVKPAQMTCEDFLSYDEVVRPQIVFLSEGLNRKGKPEDAVVDVDRINTLVPVLVEDCKKEPQSSYWQKMKARFKM